MSVANGTRSLLLLNALISLLIFCSIPVGGKVCSQVKIQNIIGQSKFRTCLSVVYPERTGES